MITHFAQVVGLAALLASSAHAGVEKLFWTRMTGTGAAMPPRSGAVMMANQTHVMISHGYGNSGLNGNSHQPFVISVGGSLSFLDSWGALP